MTIFDASKIPPQQAGGKHPVGNMFPFTITHTEKKPVSGDNNMGKFLFAVTMTSPAGSIINNYNMWNPSTQAVEIAAKQLSALCHAVGIFQVDIENGGPQLRGGKGLMDVGFQTGQGPSAEKPEGGYVEVKKVYDVNGNEPGKPNSGPANNAAAQQGGWNNNAGAATGGQQPVNQPQQQTTQQPTNQANGSGWQQPQTSGATPANAGGGWQQGAGAEKPPWG